MSCQRTPNCRYHATHDGPCEPRVDSSRDVSRSCESCEDLAKKLAAAERGAYAVAFAAKALGRERDELRARVAELESVLEAIG